MERLRRPTSWLALGLVLLSAGVTPCSAALRRTQGAAADRSAAKKSKGLLARSRELSGVSLHGGAGSPAPAAMAPAPMMLAPAAPPAMPPAPPPMAPPAPPPAPPPPPPAPPDVAPTGLQPPAPAPSGVTDCAEQCKQNKKMWEEVREADKARLDAETDRAVGQVRAEVSRLVGEVRQRIDAEGALLKVRMENQLTTQLNGQVAAFSGASAAQGAQALAHAKQNYKDLISYTHALEVAVENKTVTAGFAAAKKATEKQVKKDIDEEHVDQSSHKVLDALVASKHAWEEARNSSYDAAQRVLKTWNSSDATFRRDWSVVRNGMDGVQNAAEAVNRASRTVSWDMQESRLAAEAASSSKALALSADLKVHEAQMQANVALKAAEKNAESIKRLEAHIEELEQGAGSAAQPSGTSYSYNER